jgi:hypothetical protein
LSLIASLPFSFFSFFLFSFRFSFFLSFFYLAILMCFFGCWSILAQLGISDYRT